MFLGMLLGCDKLSIISQGLHLSIRHQDYLEPFIFSNACKFTPAGGRIVCSTRLIFPVHPAPEPSDNSRPNIDTSGDVIEEVLCAPVDDSDPLHDPTKSGGQGVESSTKKGPLKQIVVRIEVSDTGHGIPPREMAQGKLFCE